MTIPPATTLPTYCSDCSQKLDHRQIEGRTRAFCPGCEQPIYRNPKPCAGVLVIDDKEVLLVERTQPPAVGSWSVPAGYLEINEPPEVAATRELKEETGLIVKKRNIYLFDTKLVPHVDGTYVLVLLYITVRKNTTGSVVAGSDAADAHFWDLNALRSHDEKLEPGYERIFRRAINSM